MIEIKKRYLQECIICMEAYSKIGYIYEIGEGVTKSYEKAFKYYKVAADKGDAVAHIFMRKGW